MIIKITDAAKQAIYNMNLNVNQQPRIDAVVAGGCGVSLKFSFIFDEPRQNDIVFELDGIQIRMDNFTKRYLEETVLDYKTEQGFIVGYSFESSDCSIEIS